LSKEFIYNFFCKKSLEVDGVVVVVVDGFEVEVLVLDVAKVY